MNFRYTIHSVHGKDQILVAEASYPLRSRIAAIHMIKTWTRYDMGDRIRLYDDNKLFYDTHQPLRSFFMIPKQEKE